MKCYRFIVLYNWLLCNAILQAYTSPELVVGLLVLINLTKLDLSQLSMSHYKYTCQQPNCVEIDVKVMSTLISLIQFASFIVLH